MKFIDRLEKRYRRFTFEHLTKKLMVGQIVCCIAAMLQPQLVQRLALVPSAVLEGEVWRVITFAIVLDPPTGAVSALFLFFYFWLFWIMGNALENEWGKFRYNLYVLIALVLTFAAAWITPNQPTNSSYVYMSIFLAFAYLYPDFEILMFLIIPVKMKWLALITWLFLAVGFVVGDLPAKCMILAGITNFGVFFGPEIVMKLVRKKRRMAMDAEAAIEAQQPFHTCEQCGATDRTHPDREFRYVPLDGQTRCVCLDCLGASQ